MKVQPWLLKLMDRPKLSAGIRLGPEDRIVIDFANRCRAWTLDGSLRCVWHHIPNERKTTRAAGAVLKACGLIPGAPDFLFVRGPNQLGGDTFFAYIEFKSASGKQSPSQEHFERWCRQENVVYEIARSADEGELLLRDWWVLEDQ